MMRNPRAGAGRYTTPLDREILTHYYAFAGPFPRDSPHIRERIAAFLKAGLLRLDARGNVEANHEPLALYTRALAAVPFPVRVEGWRMPE